MKMLDKTNCLIVSNLLCNEFLRAYIVYQSKCIKIDLWDPSYSLLMKYMLLIFNNDGLPTTTLLRNVDGYF